MAGLKQELEQWLHEQFPGAEVALEPAKTGPNLGGTLAWKGFDGLEPIDRQTMLWRAIRSRFDRTGQLRISIIITLTPAEYAVYREPQMA